MSQTLNILHLVDYPDSKFLLGAYRTDKHQLEWILGTNLDRKEKFYNIRRNVNIFDSRDGGLLTIEQPRFVVLYNYKSPKQYMVFECIGLSEKTTPEMKDLGYPSPSGAYFLLELGKEYNIDSLDLKTFLETHKQNHPDYKNAAPIRISGKELAAFAKAEEDTSWFGASSPQKPAKKKSKPKQSMSREACIRHMLESADIREDDIERLGHGDDFESILELLLRDQSKGERDELIPQPGGRSYKHYHIIWATTDYQRRGEGYSQMDEILPRLITRKNNRIVRPRAVKSKEEQQRRIKQKAEVFTPSWVCNAQNNLVDEAWFGRKDVFNHENEDHTWTTNYEPIQFSEKRGHTWLDYVTERRLEICCGEAPYIVSRYDTTTGELIPLKDRIGLLDRKLRVVGEHAQDIEHWREYAYKAIRSIYGFEWQGDNLLLARENVLISFIEYYYDFCKHKGFDVEINTTSLAHVAFIISWNLWQMDGIRYVVPFSDQKSSTDPTLNFDESHNQEEPSHEIYAKVAYWQHDGRSKKKQVFEFRNLVKSK